MCEAPRAKQEDADGQTKFHVCPESFAKIFHEKKRAALIGNRIDVDFETDPPPDVVVEIDVHHDSRSRFRMYARLGVPEIWRYDGREMTIYLLEDEASESKARYIEHDTSAALPMLTAQLLSEMLERMRNEGELAALLAFEEWLQSRKGSV